MTNLNLIFPEIFISLAIMFLLIVGVFKKNSSNLIYNLTIISLLIALALIFNYPIETELSLFNESYKIDYLSTFMKILTLVSGIFVMLTSSKYVQITKILKIEYPVLLLSSILGMMVMISSNDLIVFYMGLELQSLSLYVLASFNTKNLLSSESGVKYFIIGALSSGILLYGLSIIYAFTNATDFYEISKSINLSLENNENFLILNVGFVLILCGLFFKIAVVPFHMWAPDVYEGSPTSITAYFTTVPKIGAIGFLIKFLNIPFANYSDAWFQIIYLVSIASMVLGSIAALNQTNIKRLLAYSSIHHMGFILIGILTANQIGIKSVQLYISIYMVNVLGIFTCILCLKNKVDGYYLENIKSFSGLLKKNSFLSFSFVILFFSLAGLPPLSGFFGKLYILISAIESKLYLLAIIAVLTSIISAFYYIKIIKTIFFDKPINDIYINISTISKLIIVVTLIISIFLIIFLSDFLEIINAASLISN